MKTHTTCFFNRTMAKVKRERVTIYVLSCTLLPAFELNLNYYLYKLKNSITTVRANWNEFGINFFNWNTLALFRYSEFTLNFNLTSCTIQWVSPYLLLKRYSILLNLLLLVLLPEVINSNFWNFQHYMLHFFLMR